MKRLIFLTAALIAAININAAVIDVDLSKAQSTSTAGSAVLEYNQESGELTVNWEVTTGWEVSGVQIPLRNVMGITAFSYEYMGEGVAIDLLPYFYDEQGNQWWDPEGQLSLEPTEWTPVSLSNPTTPLWCTPAYNFGESPMLGLRFVANPSDPTSGTFKLRNVKITISGEGPIDPNPEGQSLPLTYNGEILPINTDFVRTQSGAIGRNLAIPEVSGIACSRVTPGYIWMQSDETDAEKNSFIIATDETGSVLGAKVSFDHVYSWDWEDMCGGVYNGKNYLFIGGFGDNNTERSDYCIIWFEEPAIDPENPDVTVNAHRINFVYPDGQSHNCESMMYDNIEQKLYIVTKVYEDINQVFSLPFRTDYGDAPQTMTYVCDLGVITDIGIGEFEGKERRYKGFHLATAADITPDGKYILIKNQNNYVGIYSWVLYWEREGNESVSETLKRQPQVIDCYEVEWQGEAIAWRDNNTFYTTSDAAIKDQAPIYKYTREGYEGMANIISKKEGKVLMIDNILYVRSPKGLFTLDGRKVQ